MHHLEQQPSRGVWDEGQAAVRAVHANADFGLALGSGFGSTDSSDQSYDEGAAGSAGALPKPPGQHARVVASRARREQRRRRQKEADPERRQSTWTAIRQMAGFRNGDGSVVPEAPPGQEDVAAALERIDQRSVRAPPHPSRAGASAGGTESRELSIGTGFGGAFDGVDDGASSLATGDSTMTSSKHEDNYAAAMCEFALDMLDEIFELKAQYGLPEFAMRIGIHAGGVVGGVIGTHRPRYFIWGPDTVIANAMESACPTGQVMLSAAAKERVADIPTIEFDTPNNVNVQGISVATFLLRGVGDRDVPQVGTRVTLDEFGMPVLHMPEDVGLNRGVGTKRKYHRREVPSSPARQRQQGPSVVRIPKPVAPHKPPTPSRASTNASTTTRVVELNTGSDGADGHPNPSPPGDGDASKRGHSAGPMHHIPAEHKNPAYPVALPTGAVEPPGDDTIAGAASMPFGSSLGLESPIARRRASRPVLPVPQPSSARPKLPTIQSGDSSLSNDAVP